MQRDPRLSNASKAIAKLANECVDGGVSPAAVGAEIVIGLRDFLDHHLPSGVGSALLREMAREIETPPAGAQRAQASDQELFDVADRADQFIRMLQLSGIDESTAVTAVHNACVVAVARTRGAKGAAAWLRRVADATERNASAVDHVAQGR